MFFHDPVDKITSGSGKKPEGGTHKLLVFPVRSEISVKHLKCQISGIACVGKSVRERFPIGLSLIRYGMEIPYKIRIMDVKSAKAILTERPYGFVRALTGQPGVSDIRQAVNASRGRLSTYSASSHPLEQTFGISFDLSVIEVPYIFSIPILIPYCRQNGSSFV